MDFIRTINQVYRKAETPCQLNTAVLLEDLQDWYSHHPRNNFLHPCIIDGQAALVCHAGLSVLSPGSFASLLAVTTKHGILLKQDQRKTEQDATVNRRNKTAVVLTFCVSLMSASAHGRAGNEPAMGSRQLAVQMVSARHVSSSVGQKRGRKVIRLRHIGPPPVEQVLSAYKQNRQFQRSDRNARFKISRFLLNAYQRQPGDPTSVITDLQKTAEYYARYPRVLELFSELKDQNVFLKYKKSHWQAEASGTQYSGDQVTVYFDTRLGAQLWIHQGCKTNPACHITPADALLHELLHAKLMIVDSDDFIARGGMKPSLYLFDHESDVIAQENALFRNMTEQDHLLRPLRKRHTGELLNVSCVLCFPGGTH